MRVPRNYKEYRKASPEQKKLYAEKIKEQRLKDRIKLYGVFTKNQLWRREHKSKCREYDRVYYEKNKEKIKERARLRYLKNKHGLRNKK